MRYLLNTISYYFPLILGLKARDIIYHSRDTIARMVGGKAADIIFTSGGTEVRVSSVPGQIEIHQIILFSSLMFFILQLYSEGPIDCCIIHISTIPV